VLWLVPNSVATARCLTPRERAALAAEVARGAAEDGGGGGGGGGAAGAPRLRAALRRAAGNGYLWVCCLAGVLASVPAYTYTVYTPVLISNLLSGTALSDAASVAARPPPPGAGRAAEAGLLPVALSCIPFALAVAVSYAVAASSQRFDEVFWHVAAPYAASGAALALFPPLARAGPAAGFAALSASLALSVAGNGPALTMLVRICDGPERVVAMPLFSTFSVLGGIAGPLLTGALMSRAVRGPGVFALWQGGALRPAGAAVGRQRARPCSKAVTTAARQRRLTPLLAASAPRHPAGRLQVGHRRHGGASRRHRCARRPHAALHGRERPAAHDAQRTSAAAAEWQRGQPHEPRQPRRQRARQRQRRW
jgi:hypothetical protein